MSFLELGLTAETKAKPNCRRDTFGGNGVITENDRAEQRKRIKYNHPLANCLIFHNVHAMTAALHRLLREDVIVKEETLRYLVSFRQAYLQKAHATGG